MHISDKQREPIPRLPNGNDPLVPRWYRQLERLRLPAASKRNRAGGVPREIWRFRIAFVIILLLIWLAAIANPAAAQNSGNELAPGFGEIGESGLVMGDQLFNYPGCQKAGWNANQR